MSEDSIGFGKPPRSTRFQKGKSGNPQGRPRGSMNPALALRKSLRETVVVHENGKRRRIPKLHAIMKQAVNRAATGDPKAMQQLIALFRTFEKELASFDSNSLTPLVLNVQFVESDGDGRPLLPDPLDPDIKIT